MTMLFSSKKMLIFCRFIFEVYLGFIVVNYTGGFYPALNGVPSGQERSKDENFVDKNEPAARLFVRFALDMILRSLYGVSCKHCKYTQK